MGWSLGITTQETKHGGIYFRFSCSVIPRLQKCFELAAKEKLHEEQEHDNTVDKFAVKVVKNSKTLGHLPHVHSQNFLVKRFNEQLTATRSWFLHVYLNSRHLKKFYEY